MNPAPVLSALRRLLGPGLLLALLFTANNCRLPNDKEAVFDFQPLFLDDFSEFQGRAWQPFVVQGGLDPKIKNGRLHLAAEDQGWGVARSIVRLVKHSYYDDVDVELAVFGQEEGGRAEVEIRYQEDGEIFFAVWRISWIKDTNDWSVQPLILDEDLKTVTSSASFEISAAELHHYRISADPVRDTIEFRFDGVVRWQVDRAGLTLDPGSRLAVGQFVGGHSEVESFRAERRDLSPFVLLDNPRDAHTQPANVRVRFNLRDASGVPVVLDSSGIATRVQLDARENGEPVGVAESPLHMRAGADLAFDLVLVLDFTESMRTAGDGTGIDEMKSAARRIIFSLADTHRVAVVEFHDNQSGDDLSTLVDFTFDKNVAWAAVRDFAPFNGFSKLWDAVDHGLQLFPSSPDPERVGELVFLSDGFDASSTQTDAQVLATAQARDVVIHAVGVEEQRPVDRLAMERVATGTGGQFFTTDTVSQLRNRFAAISDDLMGTYQVAWVSPRSSGFTATLWLSLDGVRSFAPVVSTVLTGSLGGDTRRGRIQAPAATTTGPASIFFFTADHLPRRVKEIRFQFDTSALPIGQDDIRVSLAAGPLSGWTLVQEVGDWWSASGPELGFGDFGALFQVEVDHHGNDFDLPFRWDNAIYPSGVLFYAGDDGELIGDTWQSSISIVGN